jgi:hypothetical protein
MPKFKVEVEIVMVQDREIRMHSVTFVDSLDDAMVVAKSFEEQNANRGFITVWDVAKDDIVHEQPLNKHIVLI